MTVWHRQLAQPPVTGGCHEWVPAVGKGQAAGQAADHRQHPWRQQHSGRRQLRRPITGSGHHQQRAQLPQGRQRASADIRTRTAVPHFASYRSAAWCGRAASSAIEGAAAGARPGGQGDKKKGGRLIDREKERGRGGEREAGGGPVVQQANCTERRG